MYLVDGHNLIGQLADLALDDPYDEAKLTMAVRRYCMRKRRKATIIFDNGVVGGVSKQMSNSDVTVIFAPPGHQADTLLMKRAREIGGLRGKFKDMILVTSDRRIVRLAFAYGITTMPSEEFALLIGFRPIERDDDSVPVQGNAALSKTIEVVYEKDPNPVISPEEIAYWLVVFKRKIYDTRLKKQAAQKKDLGKPPHSVD